MEDQSNMTDRGRVDLRRSSKSKNVDTIRLLIDLSVIQLITDHNLKMHELTNSCLLQ